MTLSIVIPESARPFLVVQKGNLDHLKSDPKAWDKAYNEANEHLLQNILPHLNDARKLLDIGSGLGGIDILIAKETGAEVYLLDGVEDKPEVRVHRETFNDMLVAQEFMFANGVNMAGFFSPSLAFMGKDEEPKTFDLVVSFGAWCFHIEPKVYLDWVFKKTHPGSRMIVDVRKDRGWNDHIIHNGFSLVKVIRDKKKFTRNVYRRN